MRSDRLMALYEQPFLFHRENHSTRQWRKVRINKAHGFLRHHNHALRGKYFYPAYEKCFKGLLGAYAIYNYNNSTSPKPWEEVRDYEPKKNNG